MTVQFDGSASTDPSGGSLTYAWDLDGDGQYDDSTGATPSFTYGTAGTLIVRLRVTNPAFPNASSTDSITISVGAPAVEIEQPTSDLRWSVGDQIDAVGSARDLTGADIGATGLQWSLVLHHCTSIDPSHCHVHYVGSWTGPQATFVAPEHEYPSYLTLTLTATDSHGVQAGTTVDLQPATVLVTLVGDPPGAPLTLGSNQVGSGPLTYRAIRGARVSIAAAADAEAGGRTYRFARWSDGGARAHDVASLTDTTYTAAYDASPQERVLPSISGDPVAGRRLSGDTGTWDGTAPLTLSPSWERCDATGANCAAIAGATQAGIALGDADVGHTLRLRVDASNALGGVGAVSEPSAVIRRPTGAVGDDHASAREARRTLRVARSSRSAALQLRCPVAARSCRAHLALIDIGGRLHLDWLRLPRSVAIAGGSATLVHLRLAPRALARLLRAPRGLTVVVEVRTTGAAPRRIRITLLPPRR